MAASVIAPAPLSLNQWALPPQPGYLSEQADGAGETVTQDPAPQLHYSQSTEATFTGLTGVAFIREWGEEREKMKGGRAHGRSPLSPRT